MLAPVQATPQLGQLVKRGLRPAPSVAQRVDLLQDRASLLQLWASPRDGPKRLAVPFAPVMLDEEMPMRVHSGALLVPALFLASGPLGRWRTRTAPGQLGVLGRQALARAGHRAQHRFDDILD